MLFYIQPGSGIPIYIQLMEQIKHGIDTGALRPGDQLPGLRKLAETLAMNPNTVAKVYRELEHEGIIELRHGAGAFIAERAGASQLANRMKQAQPIIDTAVERLLALGLSKDEVRRLVDAALRQGDNQNGHPGN